MRNIWQLPTQLEVGGAVYPIRADFREILHIFGVLQDGQLPEFIRWYVALSLFYEGEIPEDHRREAAEKMADFFRAGYQECTDGRPLLDWVQDAPLIAADINKAAGQELRSLPFVHWWTFLGWFHTIGEGQLSTVVSIREKLAKGKKLEAHEREFYRANRALVDRKKPLSPEEQAEKARLERLLGGLRMTKGKGSKFPSSVMLSATWQE